MDQVSKFVEGGVGSAYFDIKYRPSIDNSNFNLNLCCSSLLTYMALADVTRNEEQINNLQEKFLEALVECKTEEEIKNLATFLETVSKVGGYAQIFYNNNISLINEQGKKYAQQKLKEITDEKKKPVSKFVEGGVASAYFDVKYRPWDYNDSRAIECSSLLTYMALADITRKEEQIDYLMLKFCEILSKCKTQEDYNHLADFMNITANVGGYAIEFNDKVSGLINQNGKINALEYIKNAEKEKQGNSKDLEEFKEKYERLNRELAEFRKNDMIDDKEVAYLLGKYNELQSNLYSFNGTIDKEYISKCDEEIEKAINYLKSIYKTLDDVQNMFNGL